MCGVHSTAGKWIGLSAGIAAGLAVLAGLAPQPKKDGAAPKDSAAHAGGLLAVGSKAPDWTLKDPAGKDHSLKELKGSVVVMDFWATWCGPCKQVMPAVQKIHEKYKDNKNVRVYGVSINDNGDPAKYMADKKYTYGLLLKGENVATAYGVSAIPAFVIIGPDGTILKTHVGAGNNDALIKDVSEAIDGALPKKS